MPEIPVAADSTEAYQLQRPGTKARYSRNFGDFLDGDGSPSDTISTASWTITPQSSGSPTEPTLSAESTDVSNRIATVFVENPERGEVYTLICEIVTAIGKRARRSITIRCGG